MRRPAGPEPSISVVIPCYRQARFLSRALDSVLRQPLPLEVVVVDDGSPDDVGAVCARYAGVKYVRQRHRGLAAARNRGIAETRGALLHFLDADDAAGPGMYAAMAGALAAHPEWAGAVTGTRVMHEDGTPSSLRLDAPRTANLFGSLVCRNLFPPGAVVLRRAVLERTGVFDETLDATADWDLWLRVARTGAVFGGVNAHCFEYRTYATSMSRADPVSMLASQLEMLRRARRPDARVQCADARFAGGAGDDDVAAAAAYCAASSLGVAMGHRRLEEMRLLLQRFAGYLRGSFLTADHLQTMLAEASITLGFLPPDRMRTRRACAASLQALKRSAADRYAREIVEQMLAFLEHGRLVNHEGEPIVPVPVFDSLTASYHVTTPAASRLAVVITPWREAVDGTVRLRIFDPDDAAVLRDSVATLAQLSAARTVCFRFETLEGFAGRALRFELTPQTTQPIAVYEPAASAKLLRRRLLRKLSLDRRSERLYCRMS